MECVKDEHGKEVCGPPGAKFLKIPDMVVNLNSEDGTPRYLRLSVQLEFKSAEDMTAVEQVMPRVVDQFQTYLRELRVKDLRGSAGIYRLQMELLARVNQAAYPVEVQDVLFQEILIQ
jgi:flagellar FliL protein